MPRGIRVHVVFNRDGHVGKAWLGSGGRWARAAHCRPLAYHATGRGRHRRSVVVDVRGRRHLKHLEPRGFHGRMVVSRVWYAGRA